MISYQFWGMEGNSPVEKEEGLADNEQQQTMPASLLRREALGGARGPAECSAGPRRLRGHKEFPFTLLLVGLQLIAGTAMADGLSSRYVHTSWAWRDGFKLFPVQALAQTEDGYLWLGTPTGLWRFDGQQFVQWRSSGDQERLPSQDVYCLRAADHNSLWIGTAAGVSKFERGHLKTYAVWDESTNGGVRALFEEPGRGLWAGTSGYRGGGLILVNSAGVSNFGVADGLPAAGINAIFQDHQGNLWIGTRRGLCRWSPGKPETFLTEPPTEIYSITEDSQHRLVIACSGPSKLRYLSNGTFLPLLELPPEVDSNVRAVIGHRDGSIWAGTFSSGLIQFSENGLNRFTRMDSLSHSTIQTLLEDHDGNVWVGTRTGLDRFQRSGVAQLSQDHGLSEDLITAVLGSRDGSVWIGTATAGLNRFYGEAITHKRTSDGLPSDSILSLYEDSRGRVWAGTTGGLAIGKDGRFEPVRFARGGPLKHITAIAGNRAGRVWAVDGTKGVYSVSEGAAEPVAPKGLPDSDDIYALMADDRSGLWIGYYHGELAMVKDGTVATYHADKELAPGSILGLNQDSAGSIWVASTGGLSRFRDGSWTRWRVKDGMLPSGVLQIVSDEAGGVWLVTANGVLSVDTSRMGAAVNGAPPPLRYTLYGPAQGVPPHAGIMRAQPRAARSRDGRLWFAGEVGVSILDPTRLAPKTGPPHIIIEKIQADGRTVDADPATAEPVVFRGRELQVDYRTTTLSGNEEIQFRYRLQGSDPDWVDAADGHQARYTNLVPGSYQFIVSASRTPGTWDSVSAPLTFVVYPAFYQTLWFRTLCATLIAATMFGFYKLRLRQISQRYEMLTRERLAERTRIARDLHDTLLQSVVGASLQLDALSHRLHNVAEQFDADLRRIRRQVEDALFETRHAVWALRAPALEGTDLATALRQAGPTLTASRNIRFTLKLEGKPFRFPDDVEEDLLRIAKEAIANAVRHSHGQHVHADLNYSREGLVMQIADDGRGFDPALAEAARPGHFGLCGMRERAKRLGANLQVATSPGGTRIAVSLQAPEPVHRSLFRQIFRNPFRWMTRPGSEAP
jgi:signal transduction histidine kinase/ligand-binding sensor domain-containing protein